VPADPPHDNNKWVSRSIVLIAILLSATALYVGREIFVPVAFAVLLTVSLRPIVRLLERVHVPTAAGAAIGGGFGLVSGGLIGHQIQQGEERSAAQQRQINRQQREINRLKQQQAATHTNDRY